jgi:hypothetical protein
VSTVKGVDNDPGRLFDETDDELERLLIGVARAERSSSRTRARTLAALGITGTAALAAGATAATVAPASVAVSGLGKVGLWAKLVLGVSALGTIAAAPVVYRAWHRHRAATTGVAMVQPAPTTPIDLPTAAATATAPTTVSEAPAVKPPAPPASAADLMRELGALDGVRAALARGHAARALARLDGYTLAFPHGRLEMEAEILRMDALARDGQTGAARARAAGFLRDHPKSVLAARARRYLRQ